MANRYFLNQSNSWTDTSNWSGGVVPVNNDACIFDQGSQILSNNLNQSAVTGLKLRIGPGYGGKIGTSSTYLQVGTGAELHFEGESIQGLFLDTSGGDAWIRGGSGAVNACVLKGTLTDCLVQRCKSCILQGTITNLKVEHAGNPFADVVLSVESTAAITNWLQVGGIVTAEKVASTVELMGGQLTWVDSSGATLTTLKVGNPAALFEWHAKGSTITNVYIYQGTLSSARDTSVKTMTNGECHAGAFMLLDNGADSIVGPGSGIDNYGGVVLVGESISVNQKLSVVSGLSGAAAGAAQD